MIGPLEQPGFGMSHAVNADRTEPPARLEQMNGVPDVIWLLAWCNFITAILLAVFAIMGAPAICWIIAAAGIIATPFLLAVGDIVKSLRQIAINTAKDAP